METRGTILLVEDDAQIAALIGEVLTDKGYLVAVAGTPALARAFLATVDVGLVITDGFASGGDPWEALDPLVDRA
jgi:DNA-binding response OmpR family regulator